MSNLPIGWAYLSLGEISQRITKGSTPTSYGFTYKDSGIKFIKTENIDQNGNIDGKTAYIDEATNLFLKRSILRKKDILFSIAGTIGRVGVVKGNNLPANTNQALAIIRLYHDFSYQRYVFYLLRSKIIQNQAKGSKVGVGRANVSLTDVSNFRIPLPPLPEQQRIVARIEELFTKLDAGVDALQKAKALLKQYRQSVLKAAVEGRLTEKWRTENGERIEPVSVLLERIQAERKLRLGSKYKPPKPVDTSNLSDLPDGWVWANIDSISNEVQYGSSSKTDLEMSGIPVLRMGNIVDGELDIHNLKYLPKDHVEFPELLLKKGDLLFNRTNSVELVGKTTIYNGNPNPCSFASYLIRVKFCEGIVPEFYSYYINSSYGRKWIKDVVSQQVGQANVNGTKLRNLVVPIPSASEQKEIVSVVREILLQITNSDESISNELIRSQSLRQSILKRAFEGKLVPQDPNDLPAPRPDHYYIYVLECSNGSHYIGQTHDIEKRWIEHIQGKGADWTKRYPPVKLVHWEEFNTREAAVKREKDLKTGFGRKWLKREIAAGRTRQAGEPASVLLERIKKQ